MSIWFSQCVCAQSIPTERDKQVADSSATLRSVLAQIEDCQAKLVVAGETGVAKLLSVAVLDVKLRLNNMGDVELRTITDALAERRTTSPGRAMLDETSADDRG